jgi:hypothetical protein
MPRKKSPVTRSVIEHHGDNKFCMLGIFSLHKCKRHTAYISTSPVCPLSSSLEPGNRFSQNMNSCMQSHVTITISKNGVKPWNSSAGVQRNWDFYINAMRHNIFILESLKGKKIYVCLRGEYYYRNMRIATCELVSVGLGWSHLFRFGKNFKHFSSLKNTECRVQKESLHRECV